MGLAVSSPAPGIAACRVGPRLGSGGVVARPNIVVGRVRFALGTAEGWLCISCLKSAGIGMYKRMSCGFDRSHAIRPVPSNLDTRYLSLNGDRCC